MFLKTEGLTLRPIEERDIPQMCRILTDETVKKTYMLPDFASDEEAIRLARRYIACSHDPTRVAIGICLDDQLIGFANDVGIGNGEIELGYALHPDYHGRGYMTQALTALIAALLTQGFERVIAGAFEENFASIRVMEKCGMQRMDRRETIEYRGNAHECVYYAICQEEKQI